MVIQAINNNDDIVEDSCSSDLILPPTTATTASTTTTTVIQKSLSLVLHHQGRPVAIMLLQSEEIYKVRFGSITILLIS